MNTIRESTGKIPDNLFKLIRNAQVSASSEAFTLAGAKLAVCLSCMVKARTSLTDSCKIRTLIRAVWQR